jgi:hypothetical protein
MTDDADVLIAQSVMDYLFRRLALDYLPLSTAPSSACSPSRSSRRRSLLGPTPAPRTRRRTRRRTWTSRAGAGGAGERGSRSGCCRGGSRIDRLVDRDARGDAVDRGRRCAVHDLRHEDAAGGQLLRVRGVWEHQRLQLVVAQRRALSISARRSTLTDDANDICRDVLRRLVLPVAGDAPSGFGQPHVRVLVAQPICRDLRRPVLAVGPGRGPVFGAAMPIAAVDEHGDAKAPEHDVGPAAKARKRLHVDAVAQPRSVQ